MIEKDREIEIERQTDRPGGGEEETTTQERQRIKEKTECV